MEPLLCALKGKGWTRVEGLKEMLWRAMAPGVMGDGLRFTRIFGLEKSRLGGFIRCSSTSPAAQLKTEARPRRAFADHVFYKGKCAMNIRLTKPTFKMSETGDAILAREGTLMLEFAPATGQRQYDWNKKQLFALSVPEIGQILALGGAETLEFFHDPNMGKTEAGLVRKSFKIEPTSDKTGFFFSLTVANKQEKAEARLNIPISKGEFAVLRSAANFALPYLMGWHYTTEINKVDDLSTGAPVNYTDHAPRSLVQPPSDPEWDR